MGKIMSLNRCLLVSLLILAMPAAHLCAAPTTEDQAATVVAGWLNSDSTPLDTTLGQVSLRVDTFVDSADQPIYYIVYLEPEGFVIVPADDLVEPIVGFVTAGSYDPSLANPLGALVSMDLSERVAAVRDSQRVQTDDFQQSTMSAQSKWDDLSLLADAEDLDMGLPSISDVRVAPFVQSRWSQQTECGNYCYNYYTPSHHPCGCVATAVAQVMRFHQHPVTGIGVHTFSIKVDGSSTTADTRGGDGSGGPYNWSDMVLDPGCSTTDTQRQAIGALCYDSGLSVNMSYTSSSSGTDTLKTKNALVDTFDYDNAIKGYNSSNNIGAGLDGMINPNLDSGYPVILGITGTPGGHAIVTDGYGYDSSTLYHHLNMGWAGSNDAWYDLPYIDTSNGTFTSVYKCVYNVFVSGSGEIISGRVTDIAGSPISGVSVVGQRSGGGTYNDTTDSNGIYALAKVPSSSSYAVTATKAGCSFTPQNVTTGTSSDYDSTSGNLWAIDFVNIPAPEYCEASGIVCDEYISGVEVGTISNTGTDCDKYADYTSLSTSMSIGTSYPITVTNGDPFAQDQCGIWVDWNQDKDFDDPCETIVVSGTPGGGPYTATITPPVSALPGDTRMRVRITYAGDVLACGEAYYGEVEDYTIAVYCEASGGCDEYISDVEVGTISNTGTGCDSYVDYTSLSTTMNSGASYPITVTNGNPYSNSQCGIWVDWNQDKDFDDPCETIVVFDTPGTGPYTATIIPPVAAILGDTRMRVRITYTGDVLACGTTTYGEVEDYTITVQSCSDITIGTGASYWDYPMHTYYHESRTQVIYLASEIGQSGDITALALDVTTVPGQTMDNWTIRMKHTSLSSYSTASLDATGWTTVYQDNQPAGNTGWQTFTFSTPFVYNGTDNLFIDFSHNNDSYTTSGECRESTPGGTRSACARSDSTDGDPLGWSGTTSPTVFGSPYVPNVRLTVCGGCFPPDAPVLHAEPPYVPGTCNTISWDPVTNVDGYYAEVAADENFNSVVADSGWVPDTSHEFCSLTFGQTYWYRAKARKNVACESGWSNVEFSQQAVLGDFEPDGDVDVRDLAVLASAWLSLPGDASWNSDCDISEPTDGMINLNDFAIFSGNWMAGTQ